MTRMGKKAARAAAARISARVKAATPPRSIFTADELALVSRALHRSWAYIQSDMPDPISNSGALESQLGR